MLLLYLKKYQEIDYIQLIKVDKYLYNFFKGGVYKDLIKKNKNLSNIFGLPKDIKFGKIIKQKKLAKTLRVLGYTGIWFSLN